MVWLDFGVGGFWVIDCCEVGRFVVWVLGCYPVGCLGGFGFCWVGV